MLAYSEAISTADLEMIARQTLDPSAFDYYAGGAGEEITLCENIQAFRRKRIRPRALVPVEAVDLSTTVLNRKISLPIIVGPTGLQGLAHPDAEIASARAAARCSTAFCLSTFSTKPLESVAAVADNAVRWFQLYITSERTVTRSLVERAEAAGYQAIVVTVDVPRVARRERDIRNKFRRFMAGRPSILDDPAFRALLPEARREDDLAQLDRLHPNPTASWADIEWLRGLTKLPLIVKGILRPQDARRAISLGASGIVVSNHGGRQLDRAPATIDVLPEIAREVNQEVELYLDSGIRKGADVLIALALGARAVLIGRVTLWGLAAGGEMGVSHALNLLRGELVESMVLSGAASPDELNASFVW